MPNNYDRTTHLYWFRKLERHPDEGVQALAEASCERVSSWLGMRPPTLFWFEEADFERQAKRGYEIRAGMTKLRIRSVNLAIISAGEDVQRWRSMDTLIASRRLGY